MPCTPTPAICTPIPSSVVKLAGLGHNSRCLIPIQPGPPGTTLVVSPDQQSFCWMPTHHPAHITNNKAPFEWSDANQCGNIPLVTVTQNADGSITIDPGTGSATITIPKECCPTLVKNPDGSYTFTNGDNTVITIPAITNNGCCPTLVQNPDGSYTFTNGDGTVIIIPAIDTNDCCPTLTNNGNNTYTYDRGDGNPITFTVSPPGSTPHPALTLTNNQDLVTAQPRASLDVAGFPLGQILNIAPAIFAHRRYDMPTQGKVAIPQNTWVPVPLTATTPITNIVRDTTGGAMTPASGGIVIARTGYYHLIANVTFDPPSDPTADHGIAILRNGAILQRGSAPYLTGQPPQPSAHFPFALNAGDIMGVAAFTENPGGNLHSSADLRVTWICD